jgi:hypothetical protein
MTVKGEFSAEFSLRRGRGRPYCQGIEVAASVLEVYSKFKNKIFEKEKEKKRGLEIASASLH